MVFVYITLTEKHSVLAECFFYDARDFSYGYSVYATRLPARVDASLVFIKA